MAKAEILCIGTELLLGHVLDTNSQFFCQELASIGINCFHRATVGDNKDRIKEAVKAALSRADILITSGGLGPTADDLTTECLAELFDVPLDFDQTILNRIQGFYKTIGAHMPESNRKQAMRPHGSTILPNPSGTAPGIIWQLDRKLLELIGTTSDHPKVILTFPGVPRELRAMWNDTARQFLKDQYSKEIIWSCQLKHYGIGESALGQKYAHLLNLPNPTVAPYAGDNECRLTVTAKANSEQEAKELAKPVIQEILQTSGHLCYGLDDDTLESVIGNLLIEQNKTLAVAESCTGGLISQRLTNIAGSSQYIKLNVITYSNDAKIKLLGVSEEILRQHGAVSAQCAEAMAKGIMTFAQADMGLSVTGIAGPGGGSNDKPVGLIYIGLAAAKNKYDSMKLTLPAELSRLDIRQRAANAALNMVRLSLLETVKVE